MKPPQRARELALRRLDGQQGRSETAIMARLLQWRKSKREYGKVGSQVGSQYVWHAAMAAFLLDPVNPAVFDACSQWCGSEHTAVLSSNGRTLADSFGPLAGFRDSPRSRRDRVTTTFRPTDLT